MARASPHPRRRRAAWVALLAIWSLVLLPTLSQALAAATGERAWAEVCTAQGSRWVAVGDDDSGSGVVLGHCPFCAAHATEVGPPPRAGDRMAATANGVRPGDGALLPSPAVPTWSDARPRAPPAGLR